MLFGEWIYKPSPNGYNFHKQTLREARHDMNAKEQAKAAKTFAEAWAGHGDEKSETQKFWLSLLHDVYGWEVVNLSTESNDGFCSSTESLPNC